MARERQYREGSGKKKAEVMVHVKSRERREYINSRFDKGGEREHTVVIVERDGQDFYIAIQSASLIYKSKQIFWKLTCCERKAGRW